MNAAEKRVDLPGVGHRRHHSEADLSGVSTVFGDALPAWAASTDVTEAREIMRMLFGGNEGISIV